MCAFMCACVRMPRSGYVCTGTLYSAILSTLEVIWACAWAKLSTLSVSPFMSCDCSSLVVEGDRDPDTTTEYGGLGLQGGVLQLILGSQGGVLQPIIGSQGGVLQLILGMGMLSTPAVCDAESWITVPVENMFVPATILSPFCCSVRALPFRNRESKPPRKAS